MLLGDAYAMAPATNAASWNQLIHEALVQVQLNRVAEEIRKNLKSPKDKMADTMQAINITPTQQQDHAD